MDPQQQSQPAGSFDTGQQSQPVVPGEKPRHNALRDLMSVAGVLLSALVLALCLITFVFQSYQVDGPSMQTTLENGDHLIVWKVPRTVAKITGHAYIPHRGDVVIFNANLDGREEQLVKRVMALPGERIVIKDDVVTVYNREHPEGFSPDRTLPYGSVIQQTPGDEDITVEQGKVFVMGDHRDNSRDSRDFGPVDASQLVGKLVVRILPIETFKRF